MDISAVKKLYIYIFIYLSIDLCIYVGPRRVPSQKNLWPGTRPVPSQGLSCPGAQPRGPKIKTENNPRTSSTYTNTKREGYTNGELVGIVTQKRNQNKTIVQRLVLLVAVKPLGKIRFCVLVCCCFEPFAKDGPGPTLNGSGSNNGAEGT